MIGWFSGKFIVICVKSKYCKECEYWEKKIDITEYEEWHDLHEKHCDANLSGSAGKMESDAVVEMFSRFESKYKNNVRTPTTSVTAIARHTRVFKMPGRTVILLLLKKNALDMFKKDLEQDCAI